MRTISFYGASDDLFEVETDHRDGEPDEIGCFEAPAMVKITAGGEMGGGVDGLHVFGLYAPGSVVGCWAIGILQLEDDSGASDAEGLPLPAWPMTWGVAESKYSVRLTITVPDDAKIVQVLPEPDSDE